MRRTVDDHDLLGSLFLRERVKYHVNCIAKDDTVRAELLRAPNVQVRDGIRLDVVEDIRCHLLGVAARREVLESALYGDDVVTMGAALNVRDLEVMLSSTTYIIGEKGRLLTPGAILRLQMTTPSSFEFRSLRNKLCRLTSSRTLVGDDLAKASPESVNVLAIDGDDLQTVYGQRLADLVALQVLRGVAGDGDVVIVDDQLHVEVLCDGETRRLGVVAFLSSPQPSGAARARAWNRVRTGVREGA